jgi:hypothetical protein
MGFGFIVITFLDILVMNMKGTSIFDTTFIYVLLGFGAFIALYSIVYHSNLKKIYSSNAFYREQQEIEINEEEIVFKSASSKTVISKDKLHKIMITDKMIALYISKVLAYIIPYSYVNNETKMKELINFIKTYYEIDSKK